MNKLLTKKSAIIAALCLAVLGCFIAAQGLTSTSESSAPTHKVTIRYVDSNTQEVLFSETVLVSEGGQFFTADEARAEELCTLTVQRLDSNGQEDGEAETVPLPAGATYAVGVPYTVSAPSPDPVPELPAPPAAPTAATATAKTGEPHKTIDSLIEEGVVTPYRIPGFPTAGPFWEKYGMAPDSKSAPIA